MRSARRAAASRAPDRAAGRAQGRTAPGRARRLRRPRPPTTRAPKRRRCPSSTGPTRPRARSISRGTDEERARAIDCLAAAMLYEAGDDTDGREGGRAGRAQPRAPPRLPQDDLRRGVPGVGPLDRLPVHLHLRRRARAAIAGPTPPGRARAQVADCGADGAVDKPVGYATHYHTDWVVPYWQSSLDKIAAVHTHLFFRWTGWWGTPPAFNRARLVGRTGDRRARRLFGRAQRPARALAAGAGRDGGGRSRRTRSAAAPRRRPTQQLPDDARPPHVARRLSPRSRRGRAATRDYCKVMGWTDRTKPPPRCRSRPRRSRRCRSAICATRRTVSTSRCGIAREFKERRAGAVHEAAGARAAVARRRSRRRRATAPSTARAQGARIARPATETCALNVLPGATTARLRRRPILRRRRTPRSRARAMPAGGAQAATNISGGSAITASAPPSILRRSAPASGMTRSAK